MNDRTQRDDGISPTLLATVLEAQQRHQLFPTATAGGNITLVVGVSGGADSVALLHLLLKLRHPLHLDLHVAHLDHALRPDSDQDAAFVAQLAADWGLPFHYQRLPPGALAQQSSGVEDAGRRARYAFFAQVAINVTPSAQVPCVALAHHADDQAETMLLHLLRGSGLRGLGGMRWVQEMVLNTWLPDPTLANVTLRIVRPLLQVRKIELARYLRTHRLRWHEDRSNQDPHFVRNQLRYEVLPLLTTINPAIVETLGRTATTLAAESDRATQLDQHTMAQLKIEPGQPGLDDHGTPVDRVVLDLAGLLQLDQATQRGVLRQALAQLTPQLFNSTFEHVEQLLAQIDGPTIRSSGPHPIYQDLAWSVVGPTTTHPARLSLHRQAVLPFLPAQPYLDAAWQQDHGVCPLAAGHTIQFPDGWGLHCAELPLATLPADWRQASHPWRVYLAADQIGEIGLTTPQPKQRFAPLGMGGKHKQLGDFFTDHKISPALRLGWPLVIDRQTAEVLWVCGLAIAHRVRITEQTGRVLEVAWQRP